MVGESDMKSTCSVCGKDRALTIRDGGLFCVQHRDYAKNPVSAEWEVCPVYRIRQRLASVLSVSTTSLLVVIDFLC